MSGWLCKFVNGCLYSMMEYLCSEVYVACD